jgi:hypothetical protein
MTMNESELANNHGVPTPTLESRLAMIEEGLGVLSILNRSPDLTTGALNFIQDALWEHTKAAQAAVYRRFPKTDTPSGEIIVAPTLYNDDPQWREKGE